MRASDEDLMQRCREGDMSAFELIVLRYKDAIFSFTYHFLADYHRAQDISQETFLRVLRYADRYKSRNSFKSWIYRIATNLCKNELRDKSRHKELPLDDLAVHIESRYTSPDKAYENEEVQRLVREAVNALPEDQRMAIIMREYQDMSYEEIASALNCSLGAVKSKIYRARQNIKRMLIEAEVS